MRRRMLMGTALLATLLAVPIGPARAAGDDLDPDTKLGGWLAFTCGVSLAAARIAPVPFAGIAFVSCLAAFLEGAGTADKP